MMNPVPPPPPLRRGDRVGVAALSGVVDPESLDRGLDALSDLGFEPVPAANLRSRWGIFAGDDRERLDAFHELAGDPEIRAVLFARGGWGVLRILDAIDWDLLREHPRAYVGFSDLVPFLSAVVTRLGIAAFHGPMVATDFARGLDDREKEGFLAALAGDFPLEIEVPGRLRSGIAEGPLLGGCLSLLVSTLGTQWEPDFEGTVLFLEDTDEPAYRVDRMLTHLRLSGNLTRIHGAALGSFGDEWDPAEMESWTKSSILAIPGPVGFGVAAGHEGRNVTLPLGMRAHLDVDGGVLRIG